jgi:hypothetical protein
MTPSIFTIRDDQPTITPEGLFIPEFRAIWDADKTEDKSTAIRQLAYVYHMASWGSAYANLGPEREKEVRKDYLKKGRLTTKMQAAIHKYQKLQETQEVRLLNAALSMCDKLSIHFENINFDEIDDRGQLVHDSRKAVQNIKDVGKMVESLTKLRKDVQKGLAEMGANNGFGIKSQVIDKFLD